MKIMVDTSPKNLREIEHDDWLFCISTIFQENEEYKKFYLEKKAEGSHFILDNGAFELFFNQDVTDEKKELLFNSLKKTILELQPDIVVEPDIPGNPELSKQWTAEFKKDVHLDIKWGRCIHGKNLEGAIDNYVEASNDDQVEMILLPYDSEYEKWELFESLISNNLWNKNKLHHSLGFELKDLKFWDQLNEYFFSVDSSKFVYYAPVWYRNKKLPTSDFSRPQNYFNQTYNPVAVKAFLSYLKNYKEESNE